MTARNEFHKKKIEISILHNDNAFFSNILKAGRCLLFLELVHYFAGRLVLMLDIINIKLNY